MNMRNKGLFSLLGLALIAGIGSAVAVGVNAPEAVNAETVSQVVYTCGFESTGGFSETSGYQTTHNHTDNSAEALALNASGIDWEIYFGTWSTSSKISGDLSAALRRQKSSDNLAYVMTETDIVGLTSISYNAKASTSGSSSLLLDLSYSTDQGTTWIAVESAKALTSSTKAYTANFSNVTSTDGVRVKFAIAESSVAPNTGSATYSQMTIDDIAFTVTSEVSFSSITVGGTPNKSTQYTGYPFDPTGLTFEGNDGSVIDGKDIEWNALVAGQNPTGTYKEVGVTVTSVTVLENAVDTIAIGGSMTKTSYKTGESWDPSGYTVTATMLSGHEEDVTDNVTWSYSPASPSDTSTNIVTVTATYNDKTATATANVTVVRGVAAQVSDTITYATTGLSGTSYADWSDKAGASGAVYAGNTGGANSSIQINTEATTGLYSSKSAGTIASVSLTWNDSTSTTSTRRVRVYGSNTPFASVSAITDATEIGTITLPDTSLDVTGSYAYVGINAGGGTVYLDSLSFVWNTYVCPEESAVVSTAPSRTEYMSGQSFVGDGMVVTVTYSDGSAKDVAYTGNESLFTFSPDTLSSTDTSVTGTYKEYTDTGVQFTISNISVESASLSRIEVTQEPTKSSYNAGETIDYTGLEVTAYYSDSSSTVVGPDLLDLSPAAGTMVTYADVTAGKITVSINLKSTPDTKITMDLTVNAATAVFTKVTSAEQLEIGATYTFGYQADGSDYVIPVGAFDADHYADGTEVLTNGSVFLDNDNILDFTLAPGSAEGKYALWDDTQNGYLAQTELGGTNLEIESTFSKGSLTFTFNDDGTVTINCLGERYLGHNATNSRFAFYNSATYPHVSLYKRYATSSDAYTIAGTWATNFLNATLDSCNAGSIESDWAGILENNAVPTGTLAKDFLVRGVANADTTANAISQALARYDYIVGKYTDLSDPLGRKAASGASNALRHDSKLDGEDGIILGVTLLSFAAGAAGCLLLKRSRRDSE